MVYTVIISDNADTQLKKLNSDVQERIANTLERVRIRPHVHLKRLVSIKAYSLRVGDYRIICDIDDNKLIILVIKIGHRKNVYC